MSDSEVDAYNQQYGRVVRHILIPTLVPPRW
jgi:hypothetical protein